jgi:hypothetical protein
MTSLADAFESIFRSAAKTFPQRRTRQRALHLAYGFATAWGRHTISRALCALHAQFEDWSAAYRLFSRSPWKPTDLFQPILQRCADLSDPQGPIIIALDDTTVKKTGKRIPGVRYARDPMSPPFRMNLIRGQRFIQASAIVRPEGLAGPARAIPVRFHPSPPAPKPGKRATEDQLRAYRQAQKKQNLSWHAVGLINDLRTCLNQAGYTDRTALVAVDGSYCNSTVLRNLPDNVEVVGRARGDMTLFVPPNPSDAKAKGRRPIYGAALPKPKDILADNNFPIRIDKVFGAGRLHNLQYKVVPRVQWRSGTRTRLLRLIVIAPLRYRPTHKSRLLYRDPAYLLTTDLTTPEKDLIQAYFDRWEIEVNHRDEKSSLGVGHAQVWSEQAAWRVPQFQVAIYAMLLLASLYAYGPKRTRHYFALPKWRKQEERRPSILDILALLREELIQRGVGIPQNRTGIDGQHASRLRAMTLAG